MKNLVPKRRFEEFKDSDPWEQRKLGNMGKTYTGLSGKTKDDFGHGDAEFVTYMNVFSNPVSNSNQTENVEIDERQNEVKYGDIFFTTSSETPEEVGMSSVWLGNKANVYLNSFCFGYRPTEKLDPYYMAYMLRSAEIRRKFQFLAQGISRYNISKAKVMDLSVYIPKLEEQAAIGHFFINLDNLITLHQRKLDKLKETKSAYLSEMFPKEGELYPKRRFAGFTDPWEQRKLGELCIKFTDGDWIESKDQSYEGVRLIQTGNVGVTQYLDKSNSQKWISEETFDRLHCEEIFPGDILISRLPEPAGRACIIPDIGIKMITAVDCTIVRTKPEVSNKYLVQYLSTENYFKKVNTSLAGGTRQRVSRSNLSEFIVPMPKDEKEQKRIGLLFENLDNLITLHQRKLDKLQALKQAYLSEMFV